MRADGAGRGRSLRVRAHRAGGGARREGWRCACGLVRAGPSGRQGALRTHAAIRLPPGAVRRGSIGAAAEERLAPF